MDRRWLPAVAAVAVLLALVVVLAGRGPGGSMSATAQPPAGGHGGCSVVIALGDWGPPSPYLFYPRGPGYVLTSLVFDTLVWKTREGLVPWLAESWEHPDPYTWVFHLRPGLRWSDGKPLTAEDVVFTIRYMEEHPWKWRNLPRGLVSRVYAPDNTTVVIELSKPYAFFLEDYAATLFILPEHVWSRVENPYSYTGEDAYTGSGPYVLEKYSPSEGYVFRANPLFWGPRPRCETVKVLPVGFTSPQQAAAAVKSGEADAAVFMGKAYRLVEMLERQVPGLRVEKGPMYWVLFLGFNLEKWPYNETVFRRAIAYSLNLTELVERSVGSLKAATPGSPGYIPPYSSFYNPRVRRYPYSPAKAARLLDSLGLVDRDGDGCRDLPGGGRWRPLLVAPRQYTQEALVVKEMLSRVGVCVEVKTYESLARLDEAVHRGMYDMVISGHGATGNTPSALAWFFSGRFAAAWRNETYQALVEGILSAETREEAYRYAMEAQEVIAEQLPRIALYYPYAFLVERPGSPVHWYFTPGGIDGGIPLPYNKAALLGGSG